MSVVLTQEQRTLVADTWDFRASAERSALLRFERLLRELRATDAPEVICELVERAVDDERRHIGLCDALAQDFGWRDPPSPPTPYGPLGPQGAKLEDRLLFELVAFGCVTETINVAMLLTVKKQVQDPQIRRVVSLILKDEVGHSQVGWAYLQYAYETRPIDWLSAWLPQMFEGAGVEEIYEPDSGARDVAEMAHYGELSFADRLEVFRAAAADIIFPGLERVALDTSACRHWLAQWEPTLGELPQGSRVLLKNQD